ncbi:class I SAM-dependent methyltransferase [Zavarzinia sp. CC-PAN008]|uniref:class I SAM-dependent methyltransferase n=1 Tax=Zavarzinia sp. CC-PAN008 TaxID=3243332 RepID=UPI003F7429C0
MTHAPTALEQALAAAIRAQGPITLAEYMAAAAAHPRAGYYGQRQPFGAAGDFVTAPEISQMFGELLGLWCAAMWEAMGQPASFVLAEMGPGRGTLMADARRAVRLVPGFLQAAALYFVEPSARLRAEQAALHPDARFCDRLDELPDGPLLLIANEVFDALPVHQFQVHQGHWHERVVTLDGDGRLALALGAALGPADAPEGTMRERSPAAEAMAQALGARLADQGGAALLIDYGDGVPAAPTVQTVRAHAHVGLLDRPGEADISAHVAFGALAAAARAGGAAAWGPVPQGAFLTALGIGVRAERLAAAQPARAVGIAADLHRLTAPDQMGTLFKALALTGKGLGVPPGFANAGEA